jgi:hypothetical protein
MGSVALGLAACGGGKQTEAASRELTARGSHFSVPGDWHVTRTPTTVAAAPAEGADELVSVSVFRLLRPYTPALWKRALPELDRAADQLGRELSGTLDWSRTTSVAGQAREYQFSFTRDGRDLKELITFVLRGPSEYELLCRWRAGHPRPAACTRLLESFSAA